MKKLILTLALINLTFATQAFAGVSNGVLNEEEEQAFQTSCTELEVNDEQCKCIFEYTLKEMTLEKLKIALLAQIANKYELAEDFAKSDELMKKSSELAGSAEAGLAIDNQFYDTTDASAEECVK